MALGVPFLAVAFWIVNQPTMSAAQAFVSSRTTSLANALVRVVILATRGPAAEIQPFAFGSE